MFLFCFVLFCSLVFPLARGVFAWHNPAGNYGDIIVWHIYIYIYVNYTYINSFRSSYYSLTINESTISLLKKYFLLQDLKQSVIMEKVCNCVFLKKDTDIYIC